jgi:hypothetical protein
VPTITETSVFLKGLQLFPDSVRVDLDRLVSAFKECIESCVHGDLVFWFSKLNTNSSWKNAKKFKIFIYRYLNARHNSNESVQTFEKRMILRQ